MNRPISKTTLNIVKDGFEEEKNVKVLSIFERNNDIYGIYVVRITDALSFLKDPLYNMRTDIDGHNIYMIELGTLLIASYRHGSIKMYNWLIHDSNIKIRNKLFDELISNCIDNPPLNLASFRLIKSIDDMNKGCLPERVSDLVELVEEFMEIDQLDIDVSDKSSTIVMHNNLNLVRQELKGRNYKKINESFMNLIDDLFIDLQLDLYITDET